MNVYLVKNGSRVLEITLGSIMFCIPVRHWFYSSKMSLCVCAHPLAFLYVYVTECGRIIWNLEKERMSLALVSDWKSTVTDVSLINMKINMNKALINNKHKGWREYKTE